MFYFAFNTVRWGITYQDFGHSFQSNLLEFSLNIFVSYITLYYFLPRFILKGKYLQFIFILVLILVLAYIIRTELSLLLLYEGAPAIERAFFDDSYSVSHATLMIIGQMYVLGFVASILLIISWTKERSRSAELTELQLSTELKYLKTQIQPHFFFNTLNNLYALTLQKSDNAPHFVLKLSEMMHYMLYEVSTSKAKLLEEINHINNYIDIENLRFENRIEAQVNITGAVEAVKVPPLLFLSFIENYFNYCLKKINKIKIDISFNLINNSHLEFTLKTNCDLKTINPDIKQTSNLKRRLDLLYKNNYILTYNKKNDFFILYLKIPLS